MRCFRLRAAVVGLAVLAATLWSSSLDRVSAAQFPGEGDSIRRLAQIIDAERRARAAREPEPPKEDRGMRITAPKEGERLQLDHWRYAPGVDGVDPLTQVVRFVGRIEGSNYVVSGGGTGFLLPGCRVMTNLHVIAGMHPQGDTIVAAGGSLVGMEFFYVSSSVPWLNYGSVFGSVVVLGHGKIETVRPDANFLPQDEDWAVGYDLACTSERFSLGVLHLGYPVQLPRLELHEFKTFAAGFPNISMSGLSGRTYPLLIDTKCGLSWVQSRSDFRSNCVSDHGASGQPLLSGLLTVPGNPSRFRSENGRPVLEVKAMLWGGNDDNDISAFILFDVRTRERIDPLLTQPVDAARLRRRTVDLDLPQALGRVFPFYLGDASRRPSLSKGIDVNFTVRPDGTVRDAAVVRSLGPDLDALALEAARKWFFAPAVRNGRAVEARVAYTLGYLLPE